MKSALIPIKPKWCELIASGKKTIEVRKTRPKIKTPFKCYIYCTKEHTADDRLWIFGKKAQFGTSVNIAHICGAKDVGGAYKGNGKVIGEFVCDDIDKIAHVGTRSDDIHLRIVDENFYCKELDYEYVNNKCCISIRDLEECSNGGTIFGWHISDLVIYDKPKCVGDFRHCGVNYHFDPPVTKPPQSWCYVEEFIK